MSTLLPSTLLPLLPVAGPSDSMGQELATGGRLQASLQPVTPLARTTSFSDVFWGSSPFFIPPTKSKHTPAHAP